MGNQTTPPRLTIKLILGSKGSRDSSRLALARTASPARTTSLAGRLGGSCGSGTAILLGNLLGFSLDLVPLKTNSLLGAVGHLDVLEADFGLTVASSQLLDDLDEQHVLCERVGGLEGSPSH